jgi:orotate phosphoribosyltransferase
MTSGAPTEKPSTPVTRELFQLVKERAYREGNFTLSSGKTSTYYFDGKKVLLDHQGSRLFARWLLEQIATLSPRPVAIGGLEIGAIPIACVAMALSESPLGTFIVRKKAKAHGTGSELEGELKPGDPVVVVDDVITTGESTMKAVRALERDGCKVMAIYCLVDRNEGHTPDFEERKPIFRPAFTIEDFQSRR